MTKISAHVITCDRDPEILNAVLRSVRFADDIVLVDKAKNKPVNAWALNTQLIRYQRVPWSPTVEVTRKLAEDYCVNDWIIRVDDDEILSPACEEAFREVASGDICDVLSVPIQHFILGRFDPRAYNAREIKPTFYKRGKLEFSPVLHGGMTPRGRHMATATPAHIIHLSHPDIYSWIEKSNFYTELERTGEQAPPKGRFVEWAAAKLVEYCSEAHQGEDYLDTIALLRGLYSIVDGLKVWEQTQSNGKETFRRIAEGLFQ